ncbi:MAG: alginate export family protein, partial [Planctomycetaceae bacterium]|nr:alginate export family protein [Planctomycetaceae bacterium]
MNRVTKLIVVLALGISSADAADPTCSSVDQLFCNPTDCWLDGCGDWLSSDAKLLAPLQNQPLGNGWTSSVGGELRYRYIDERNRLRPPTPAGRSTYDQYRFNPYVDLNYTDLIQFHVEAIGAQTNGNELPQLSIDENRADLLQYYVDINLADFDNDGT